MSIQILFEYFIILKYFTTLVYHRFCSDEPAVNTICLSACSDYILTQIIVLVLQREMCSSDTLLYDNTVTIRTQKIGSDNSKLKLYRKNTNSIDSFSVAVATTTTLNESVIDRVTEVYANLKELDRCDKQNAACLAT